jgi:hypothetical protein
MIGAGDRCHLSLDFRRSGWLCGSTCRSWPSIFRKHEAERWLNKREGVLEIECHVWSDKTPPPQDVSPNRDTITPLFEIHQSSKVPSFSFAINGPIIRFQLQETIFSCRIALDVARHTDVWPLSFKIFRLTTRKPWISRLVDLIELLSPIHLTLIQYQGSGEKPTGPVDEQWSSEIHQTSYVVDYELREKSNPIRLESNLARSAINTMDLPTNK